MQANITVPHFSKMMKYLVGAFLFTWIFIQIVGEKFLNLPIIEIFGLTPGSVLLNGFIWQIFTYIFLHSYEVSHILLNLLMTWFLGAELERVWGSRKFLLYYLGSGIGAAILYTLSVFTWHSLIGGAQGLITPVVGASGSVFGLMVAYGILFGDRTIHFMMLFPMKARVFVLILAGVEILSLLSHGIAGSGVANLAHLGGVLSGYLILLFMAKQKKKSASAKSAKKAGLRLVVDNEKDSNNKTRYWN